MKTLFWCAMLGCAGAASAASPQDLAGWWSADAVHGGESSHIALQIRARDKAPGETGALEARLWLMDIGAYDVGLGEVAINGDALDTKGLSFPLAWNADKQTLSGIIPAEAAPVEKKTEAAAAKA